MTTSGTGLNAWRIGAWPSITFGRRRLSDGPSMGYQIDLEAQQWSSRAVVLSKMTGESIRVLTHTLVTESDVGGMVRGQE